MFTEDITPTTQGRGSFFFAGVQWLMAGAAMAEWMVLAAALGAGLLLGWLLTRQTEKTLG
jgi:hypothetical protein